MSSLLTDLKAYYSFEGNGNDVSGSGNDATVNNVTFSLPNGKVLQGGAFDETLPSQFTKNSSSMLTGNNSTSLCGWIRLTTNSGNSPCPINLGNQVGGGSNGMHFYIGGGDILNFGDFQQGYAGTFIGDGLWHFACATYNSVSGNVRFYIDNTLYVNTTISLNLLNSNIHLGYWDPSFLPPGTTSYVFTGDIDEVGFWQRELTVTEVGELYNAGAGLTYPFGPVSAPTNASFLFNIL